MTVFRYALKRMLRSRATLLLLALPFGLLLLPAQRGWEPLLPAWHYYGLLLLLLAARLPALLLVERTSGVLLRVASSPISHLRYLAEHMLAYGALLGLQIGAFVGAGMLRYRDPVQPWPLLAVYAAFALAALALVLAWCSLFRNRETSALILFSLCMLAMMLGGLLWPVQALPAALQRTAWLIPTYWLGEGYRTVAAGDHSALLAAIGMLLLFAAAGLLLGSRRRLN
ncbi:ABC transporter permease [Paenibacillus sp. IB182496]|uniref:ABC transporter permease n=1 Tax=Paenibacillus sabuli TaxID=2772509 RepID=A0A927GSV9_9BACL|nr:ABC transporter permease [Paenibacillus sabuli]MBD2846077.1 ABC transporter permease [Paenibacillus sabuli]